MIANDEPNLKVMVQREQIEDLELWFFEVSNAKIGDAVTKYMQSRLFDRSPKRQPKLRKKSKETLTKAYLGVSGRKSEDQGGRESRGDMESGLSICHSHQWGEACDGQHG
ncbi:hypothetical protein CsSME_00033366 [Camellia sinensis var. sinensis]